MEHAFYIWCAYGVSALILSWTAIAPLIRQRHAIREQRDRNLSADQP